MKLRHKKRGAALPGAIILCSLIVLVSMGLAIILLQISSINQINRMNDENQIVYAQGFSKFKSTGSVPADTDRFTWHVYEKEGDTNIKALTATFRESNTLGFYAICDFSTSPLQTLAYQTKDFYITYSEGYQYLGGIVKMVN